MYPIDLSRYQSSGIMGRNRNSLSRAIKNRQNVVSGQYQQSQNSIPTQSQQQQLNNKPTSSTMMYGQYNAPDNNFPYDGTKGLEAGYTKIPGLINTPAPPQQAVDWLNNMFKQRQQRSVQEQQMKLDQDRLEEERKRREQDQIGVGGG